MITTTCTTLEHLTLDIGADQIKRAYLIISDQRHLGGGLRVLKDNRYGRNSTITEEELGEEYGEYLGEPAGSSGVYGEGEPEIKAVVTQPNPEKIKPIYDWVDGERVEQDQWLEGVIAPDADGNLVIHGGLTTDPCYAAVVPAWELYQHLKEYFRGAEGENT